MGGRSAERLVLGEISTGASNDLAGATQVATRMVREFGMSSRLGPVGFSTGEPQYLGEQQVASRPYAEATQRVIDEEVSRLLADAEERANALLEPHRDELMRIVDLLLKRETIDGADVEEIVGKPGRPEPALVLPDDAVVGHRAAGDPGSRAKGNPT